MLQQRPCSRCSHLRQWVQTMPLQQDTSLQFHDARSPRQLFGHIPDAGDVSCPQMFPVCKLIPGFAGFAGSMAAASVPAQPSERAASKQKNADDSWTSAAGCSSCHAAGSATKRTGWRQRWHEIKAAAQKIEHMAVQQRLALWQLSWRRNGSCQARMASHARCQHSSSSSDCAFATEQC